MSITCNIHVYIAADEEYHLGGSSFALDLCSLLSHAQTILPMLRFPISTQFFNNSPCMWGFSSSKYAAAHDAYLRGTTISLLFCSCRLACIFGFLLWHCNMYDRVKKKRTLPDISLPPLIPSMLHESAGGWLLSGREPSGPTNLLPSPTRRPQKLVLDFWEAKKRKRIDRRRDRTCNLLIRSQAPCHWASRPVW